TITSVVGLCGIAFGVWYAYIRRPVLRVLVWVFENGLYLQRGGDVEACSWEDVKDFRTDHPAGRPRYLLTTRGNFRFMLTPDISASVMPLAEYIGLKLAAAQLLLKLRRIFEEDRVRFGVITLDRAGIRAPGFFARWADVQRVVLDESKVFIDCR